MKSKSLLKQTKQQARKGAPGSASTPKHDNYVYILFGSAYEPEINWHVRLSIRNHTEFELKS